MSKNGHKLEPDTSSGKGGGSEIDFRSLFFKVLKYWYLLPIGLALGLFLGSLYLRYTVPVYLVSNAVLIKGDAENSGTALSQSSIVQDLVGFGQSNNILNEMQLLRSRSLMAQVIEDLGLGTNYTLLGKIREHQYYGNSPIFLDTIRWGSRQRSLDLQVKVVDDYQFIIRGVDEDRTFQFGGPFLLGKDTLVLNRNFAYSVPEEDIAVRVRPSHVLAAALIENLEVIIEEEFSSILRLEYEDPVPQRGADILNQLISVYNEAAVEEKKQLDRETLDFISERLARLTSELTAVESNVALFKQQNEIPTEAGASVNLIMSEIARYESQLVEQNVTLDLINSIEERLSRDSLRDELIPANSILENTGNLVAQIANYNRIVLERQRIARSAGEDNPMLISVNEQLKEIRQSIMLSITSSKQDLKLQIQKTEASLRELKGRMNTVPQLEKELLEIKRQQNIKEGLYLFLLEKKEVTALSAAITPANARMVDAAIVEGVKQVSPKALVVYAGSGVLGLALPFSIIFLLYYLDDKIYSEEDIKSQTTIPIAGMIGHSRSRDRIVIRQNLNTPVAEMFRMIRTNLNYLVDDPPCRTVMVTSTLGGEGKTFLSANLGMSLALSGVKTVIMGVDLRKPELANYLENKPDQGTTGLSNFLIRETDPEEIIHPSANSTNLFYIPSGPIPPNPAELLAGDRLATLFEYLRINFDMIIIDTAPVGLVTDSLLVNRHIGVDLTLIPLRYGYTPKGVIRFVEREKKNGKIVNPAFVLNGVKMTKMNQYQYGYGYGYGYGYSKYATNPGKAKKVFRKIRKAVKI